MARLSQEYNLQVINPSLAKQWHPIKNGSLTQKDVFPKSGKKVWWICDKGHEWESAISNRSNGSGCPYCSGREVCKDNCLETVNPALARQWHPVKNGSLTPKDVTPMSGKKVWWETIERRGELLATGSYGAGEWHWRYRNGNESKFTDPNANVR